MVSCLQLKRIVVLRMIQLTMEPWSIIHWREMLWATVLHILWWLIHTTLIWMTMLTMLTMLMMLWRTSCNQMTQLFQLLVQRLLSIRDLPEF